MADGFAVASGQIRAHARNVEAVRGRFAAVKAASAHIANDEAAYGLLCGWIAGILEGRHTRQDELFAYVEENLSLAVAGLQKTADGYDGVESDAHDLIGRIGDRLGP